MNAWDETRQSPAERDAWAKWAEALLRGDTEQAAYYRTVGLAAKEERLYAVPTLTDGPRRKQRSV